jgi:TRAP-type C4-dicarboxylate transport system permease small subunit
MGELPKLVLKLAKGMEVIAGTALTAIMLLTVTDVCLRLADRPIMGVYEVVAMLGAVVIGFVAPLTSWRRGHVSVDFLLAKLPGRWRAAVNVATRLVAFGLFLAIGVNLLWIGADLREVGEVSLTIQLPTYPVAYGLAGCCFALALVLLSDVFKIAAGSPEWSEGAQGGHGAEEVA